MKRLHVAVLMGGPSAEREVSCQSGRVVVQALLNAGAQVCEVDVQGPDFWLPSNIHVAFIALHGTFGEDGQIQRILEERGVPYTGSDVEASALAFDKGAAKAEFVAAGIPTPQYAVIERDLTPLAAMQPPLVIKPARQGSSVGITIVKVRSELEQACAPGLAIRRTPDRRAVHPRTRADRRHSRRQNIAGHRDLHQARVLRLSGEVHTRRDGGNRAGAARPVDDRSRPGPCETGA